MIKYIELSAWAEGIKTCFGGWSSWLTHRAHPDCRKGQLIDLVIELGSQQQHPHTGSAHTLSQLQY